MNIKYELKDILLSGCRKDIKLTCTYENTDLEVTTKYTLYYENADSAKPKKFAGLTIYKNVGNTDIEDLRKKHCTANTDACSVKTTNDGYKVEWSYNIAADQQIVYGPYESVIKMLEPSGWICE